VHGRPEDGPVVSRGGPQVIVVDRAGAGYDPGQVHPDDVGGQPFPEQIGPGAGRELLRVVPDPYVHPGNCRTRREGRSSHISPISP